MVDCASHVLSVGRNIERGMRKRREKREAGRGTESRTIEMITGALGCIDNSGRQEQLLQCEQRDKHFCSKRFLDDSYKYGDQVAFHGLLW